MRNLSSFITVRTGGYRTLDRLIVEIRVVHGLGIGVMLHPGALIIFVKIRFFSGILAIFARTHLLTMEYLSKERYDEIVAELKNLIEVEYPRIKDELSEARAQGDLSENFEYRAARRAQGKAISRIRFLQKVLEHSRVIDKEALPKDRISLLSKVEFTNLSNGTKMAFTIVSHHEMNLEQGKLSCNSPIGKALMGHKEGEEVDVAAPAGTFRIRIDKVTF